MVGSSLGDSFGQEKSSLDTARAILAGGGTVTLIADTFHGADLGLGATKQIRIPGLGALNSLTGLSKRRGIERAFKAAVVTSIAPTGPTIIHLVDFLDWRILKIATKAAPAVLSAHTVSLTCPASHRQSIQDVSCTSQSGWICVANHRRHQCLSFSKSDLHRTHAVGDYLLRRRAGRQIRRVFAISPYVEQCLLEDGWRQDQVVLLPNSVEVSKNRMHQQKLPDVPVILTAARLTPLKGIDHAVRALVQVADLKWEYWICGEGPDRKALEKLAQDFGLSARVKFLGKTPFSETHALMEEAAFLLQSNLGPEGFGLSVAESLLLGTPVVAYGVPAIPDLVIPQETGLLAEPKNPEDLAEKIRYALTHPDQMKKMGEQGKARVVAAHSFAAHQGRIFEEYRRTTGI